MPKVLYTIFCDNAFPSDRGKSNFIGIFDEVSLKKSEVTNAYTFPLFFICLRIIDFPAGTKLSLNFKHQDQTEITPLKVIDNLFISPPNPTKETGIVMIAVNLLNFSSPGYWHLYIKFDMGIEEEISSLNVKHIP